MSLYRRWILSSVFSVSKGDQCWIYNCLFHMSCSSYMRTISHLSLSTTRKRLHLTFIFLPILYLLQVGKILLNALLYQGIKTNLQKNSIVAIFHTSVIRLNQNYLFYFIWKWSTVWTTPVSVNLTSMVLESLRWLFFLNDIFMNVQFSTHSNNLSVT